MSNFTSTRLKTSFFFSRKNILLIDNYLKLKIVFFHDLCPENKKCIYHKEASGRQLELLLAVENSFITVIHFDTIIVRQTLQKARLEGAYKCKLQF